MPTIKINDVELSVAPGTLVLDACRTVGIDIPHYCYHPALTPVATCRMCLVEIKGQPKLATSCTTPVPPAPKDNPDAVVMEVLTNSPAVADARAGVMEFLLINHPLDCPICDQAGECKLQDYSYDYGSGDSRMAEVKRRYRYEDLGAKIVIDKNRCIHCTRCVRFTREISGGGELIVAQRGAGLEVTTYTGKTLDQNPYAGNVVDLCPVGALTSRDFRFRKRVWYLKSTPSISRHSALGSPIWIDHEGNRVYRLRPRPLEGKETTHFISDEERYAYGHYNRADAAPLPMLKGAPTSFDDVRAALQAAGSVAVIGQGTFGCDAAQRLGDVAASPELRYGSGDRTIPVVLPKYQTSADGILNRRGFTERGFRFGALEELLGKVQAGEVKAVVLLHDAAFTSAKETELLGRILQAASFSLALEVTPSDLGRSATAWLPIASYVEESDFIVNHDGELRRYQKAIQPPQGVRPVAALARDLAAVPAAV
ncbi:2Fe-2S iron-sulfur cluster-binding protein [Geothrix sp. 21YS21S-4]|uniref:2Fe-2S iron-sulfur cluster-binding protein n=1 Tax=Geothrix sp. 21YS21S-4 TaxID=3068889 RepID=UPI0027BAC34F|nr:2Fe-2S iron-sulfur cluster-binding protein [Geothrix sp. 21YS21S-4]